jgi:hypothetical protein
MHKLAVRRRPVVSTDQFTPYAQSGAATYIPYIGNAWVIFKINIF